MVRKNPPICNLCNKSTTIDHLILECAKYEDKRKKNNITNESLNFLNDTVTIYTK